MTEAELDATDVVVIGDGPAGSALGQACARAGVDVVVVGDDRDWTNTYGSWVDDLRAVDLLRGDDILAVGPFDVVAWSDRRHDLRRPYGILDNSLLRTLLRADVAHRTGRVASVRTDDRGHLIELESGESIRCRVVVDAAGWPARFAGGVLTAAESPAWQTAFGVVLTDPPDGDLGVPTVMDFRAPASSIGSTDLDELSTFAYSLPVTDGWLVEETVLAARPAVPPIALLPRLAARLGIGADELLAAAVRTEHVRIPMGGARPRRDQPIVAFGAAAGYVNPTSGFAVVHSMAMVVPVAEAIRAALGASPPDRAVDALPIWNAVWPLAHRRTRTLHDYGLDMLTRLDAAATRRFFGQFFDLPADVWPSYMRPTTPPRELSAVMARLFKQAPWSTRRRLMAGDPTAFVRLLRPS